MSEPAPKSIHTVVSDFQKKLFASRFFTISVLLHFILVVTLGTTALFHAASEPDDFTGGDGGGGGFIEAENASPPPPVEVAQQPDTQMQPDVNLNTAIPSMDNTIEAITTSAPTDAAFTIPAIAPPVVTPTASIASTVPPPQVPTTPTASGQLTAAQAATIGKFTQQWAPDGPGGRGSSVKDRRFEFTAYLAKYGNPNDRERGGNWASTVRLDKDRVVGGSLPNLLWLMNRLSGNRIKANPDPVPLDLSSDAIFAHRPPFIFFTGHRDFTLTDKEVENLRKYVSSGGCIWGDSSLPGRRSRFDIAFRREMRRVISDADKDWETLPANHPLYTNERNMYFREIKEPPPGMNFYQEPVYALKFAGEVAIIYTANDYGDMWQFGVDTQGKFDYSRDEKRQYVAMNAAMLRHRGTYFRNVEEPAVFNTFKFGTNVVMHLLTRWEDRLRTAPRGL